MKLMIYSSDAFELGSIRRMLAICQYLLRMFPEISILIVSDSSILHRLRLSAGLDYIKLPCLAYDQTGNLLVQYLHTDLEETVGLRSQLILVAAQHFKPDLVLVDKKPEGLNSELRQTLNYLQAHAPQTRCVLILRDILDAPATTIREWQTHHYYHLTEQHYDEVWVVGCQQIFDVCQAYQFPTTLAQKVYFLGYIQREPGLVSRRMVQHALALAPQTPLVLVTVGGSDGYYLLSQYLQGLQAYPSNLDHQSLLISGSEFSLGQRDLLRLQAQRLSQVRLQEFTDDLTGYLEAADVVISMADYNTISEILSLGKRAIVVPRVRPSEEQWIRAQKLDELGVLTAIHPDQLSPQRLMSALSTQLQQSESPFLPSQLDMHALPRVAHRVQKLLPAHFLGEPFVGNNSCKPLCLVTETA